VKPYGGKQEHFLIDRKRRYLSRAMAPSDRREERRDKRQARAQGKREIAAQGAA